MIFLDLAFRNVLRNRERSLLTLIGVLLAVGSFVALVSLAEGLYQRVRAEMDGRSVDIYVIPNSAMALPSGPVGTVGLTTDTISLDALDQLRQLPEVERAEGVLRLTWTGGKTAVPVLAIDPQAVLLFMPNLRFVAEGMMMMSEGEAMVGAGVARTEFSGVSDWTLTIGQKSYPVTAVVTGGGFQDYFAYIPLESALAGDPEPGVGEVWIKLNDPHLAQGVVDKINEHLRIPNARAMTRREYLGSANDFVGLAWMLQFAISAIGVLIAITASMNTMLMSTYERLREFSTMRAIGASRATVASMIVAESVMLNLAGGLLGLLFGWIASGVLDRAVVVLLQVPFPLATVTFKLLLQAVLLSVFVGVLGAIIPCFLVWRLNIVKALRFD